jgi:uncharacterized RDD family membrane protein YckC
MRDPWAEDIAIRSSENVEFGVESAGLGSRFAAAAVDIGIQTLVLAIGSIVVTRAMFWLPLDEWSSLARSISAALLALAGFAIIWGYYFVFEWRNDGQTPGKKALGIRVMQLDGMPVTLWGALIRNLLRFVDFLPALYGVGAVVALVNPNHRRAGDLVAGTIVARERHDAAKPVLGIAQASEAFLSSNPAPSAPKEPTSVPAPEAAPTGATPTGATITAVATESVELESMAVAMRLNAHDIEMAQDFLRRRDRLAAPVRARIAGSLASQLARKMGLPEAPADPEELLQRVASHNAASDQAKP